MSNSCRMRADGRVALAQDGQEDVFGGDELILQPVGFALRQLQNGANPRCVEYLPHTAAIDRDLWAGAEFAVEPFLQGS